MKLLIVVLIGNCAYRSFPRGRGNSWFAHPSRPGRPQRGGVKRGGTQAMRLLSLVPISNRVYLG